MYDDLPLFIQTGQTENLELPWCRVEWLCKPGLVDAQRLQLCRVTMPAGECHQFHKHPTMEELIYVVEGRAEQWVERDKRILGPGEMAHIPADVVHGTYNGFDEALVFLAILSPARSEGPPIVDVWDLEPWCSLKEPVRYCEPEGRDS